MLSGNVKLALASIKSAKARSLFTMLGVIVGVASVVLTVGLGEGAKRQVASQINHLGNDLITIRPGKTVNRDANGKITGINFLAGLASSTLTENDLESIRQTPGIKLAVPSSFIAGSVRANNQEMPGGLIIATTDQMPDILNQKIEFGGFFEPSDSQRHVVVIGKKVAAQLFQEFAPIGKSIQIRGESFIITGVFDEFASNPLTPGSDFNSALFIPFGTGKLLTNGSAQIVQILAKSTDPSQTDMVVNALNQQLKTNHGGEEDFSVLKQDDTLAITGNVLGLMTKLVAGIAAISLAVGGIGIMNIMLVSVTERTHEIGIRKAVGATNQQILVQFLTESVVLSIVGGLLGVALAGLVSLLLIITTDLHPTITPQVVLLATWVTLLVGVIFGLVPAVKAAHKDPIDALRYE